jgi:CubicO group peptidase (beta-lactamase class C family)
MRSLLTSLVIIALIAPATTAQTPAQIDRLAAATLQQWKLPGLAVAVVKDDKVILAKGYGVRELGGSAPVTDETLFQIASTSKAFTSAGLAMLVDEKKLSWDDPVRQYVDYFHLDDACADAQVTVRDILSHRTGLSRHDELWDDSNLSREEIIRAVAHIKPNKPFRTTYQYNNIMFMTAGEVMARVAGMPWDAFLRRRFFEPLGMSRTVTTFAEWSAAANRASSHIWHANPGAFAVIPVTNEDSLGPAGTIASCARDMARWVRFQLSSPSPALAETKSPQTIIPLTGDTRDINPDATLDAYGMGWTIQDYHGEPLIAHAGALNQMRTQVALLPREHAGIVVMTNAGRGFAMYALRNAIVDLIANRPPRDWNAWYLGVEKKLDDAAEQSKREREAKRRRDTHPSHDLAAYAGTYRDPAYGQATVTLENGGLVFRWNRLVLPLTHWQYDTFNAFDEAHGIDELATFRTGDDGEVNTLTIFGEDFKAVR